jgi:hypothetical protein
MPRSMQYCRRSSSRVDGRLVGRDGVAVAVPVVARVGFGVGVARSVVLVGFRVGRWVGRWAGTVVGPLLGARIVCGTSGGVDVVRGTAGLVEPAAGLGDGDSSANFTAAESSDPPSNRPIVDNAHRLTPANTISAAAPAYTARRDGAPYWPIGPWTGLPLPSTQNRQPSGAGGQVGSGRQVFGGTQLRRGGDGQLGGTTNRFKRTPPLTDADPPHQANDTDPARATCGFATARVSARFFDQPPRETPI